MGEKEGLFVGEGVQVGLVLQVSRNEVRIFSWLGERSDLVFLEYDCVEGLNYIYRMSVKAQGRFFCYVYYQRSYGC